MRRVASCLFVVLAALSACSKSPAPAASSGAASAPAPRAPALFSRPHPRLGLWRMTMINHIGPGMTVSSEVCLDQQTENAAFQAAPSVRSKRNCDEPKFGPAPGGGVAFDMVCNSQDRKVTTHAVMAGDFNSAYTMDMTTRMDPAPPGMADGMKMHTDAKWLGPCKPGQTPGQMSVKMGSLGRG